MQHKNYLPRVVSDNPATVATVVISIDCVVLQEVLLDT